MAGQHLENDDAKLPPIHGYGRALCKRGHILVITLEMFVVAPPSSVVKCLWEVFVWGFGVLFLSCVCVSVCVRCRGCRSVGVCACVTWWSFYDRKVTPWQEKKVALERDGLWVCRKWRYRAATNLRLRSSPRQTKGQRGVLYTYIPIFEVRFPPTTYHSWPFISVMSNTITDNSNNERTFPRMTSGEYYGLPTQSFICMRLYMCTTIADIVLHMYRDVVYLLL